MFNKLKELKDLRNQGKKMKSMMDEIVVVGGSGGNKVMVTLNGSHEMLGVQIDEELDRAKIADAFKEAYADAAKKLQSEMMKKMKEMGGLGGLGDMMKGMGG